MLEQSFAFTDIPRIFALTFLELILSADNAAVLAIMSRTLPLPLRRKALFIGLASSFILRAGALFSAALILKYIWVQILGGFYLIFLSTRHFSKKSKSSQLAPSHSFWKTVLLIELLDLIFALDSIVAGIAFIDSNFSKLWIVYAGGMIGLIGMRYAADFFSSLLDRFPRLETSAYLMVGWIGIKLGLAGGGYPIPPFVFWTFMALLFLLGFFKRER